MRRTLRIVVVSLFVVLSLAGLLVFGVATGWMPGLTRALVQWAASNALRQEVRVARVLGAPLDSLTLEGVSIGPAESPHLRIGAIHSALGYASFTERRIVLESLRLVGIDLRIGRDAAGAWTLDGWDPLSSAAAPSPDAAPAPVLLEVGTLAIEDAHLSAAWGEGTGRVQVAGGIGLKARDVHWPPDAAHAWPESVEARVDLESARLADREFANGSLVAQLRAGSLVLDASSVQVAGGQIDLRVTGTLSGSLEAPELRDLAGQLRTRAIDLASLAPGDLPESSLQGVLDFGWDGSLLTVRATIEPSIVEGERLESGELRGRLWPRGDETAFELDDVRLVAPSASLDASVAGDRKRARHVTVRRAEIDLSALPSRWQVSGWSEGVVTLAGELAGDWSDLSGKLSVGLAKGRHVDLGAVSGRFEGSALGGGRLRVESLVVDAGDGSLPSFAAEGPFDLRLEPGGLLLEGARLRALGGTLQVDGGFAAGRFQDLHLRAHGLLAAMLAGRFTDLDLDGTIDADLQLEGPSAAPAATGEVDWLEPRVADVAAQRIRADLAPREGASMELRVVVVRSDTEVLDARTVLPLRDLLASQEPLLDRADLRADLELRGFEVAWLQPLLPPETLPLGGTIEGHAAVQGPLRSPSVDADLAWTGPSLGELTADRISLQTASPGNGKPLHAQVRVTLAGVEALEAELEIPHRERLASPRELLADSEARLRLRLDGFDVEWLRPPEIQETLLVGGRLTGQVRIEGGSIPSALGELRIEDLTLSGAPLPTQIGPTSARVEFAGDTLRLAGLSFASGDGSLRLRGSLSWQDPSDPEARLDARLSSFALQQPGVVEGVLDGEIEVVGRPKALKARGGLVLHHARLDLPDREDPIVREIRVQRLPSRDEASVFDEDALAGAEGELVLRLGESVQLRGVGAELELEGELVARKRPGEPPGLFGSVDVVSGRFDFRGKWLRVVSGSAVFDGSPDPDPFVDATAVHRVRDVEIRVRLFGRASALELEIDSDPPMSREEQLAYLLFDRPVFELSADDQVRIGTAAGVLAGDLVLGQLGNEIAREVGLDRVRLGVDDEALPTFEIEKQVHERVTARYGRSFGAEGGDRFVIEWRLFRNLFLSGEQETSGSSAVDVFWRLEY